MSPLDDELRRTLAARAGALAPGPDPMAGVEARAGRLHRRRVALAVSGAALAVAAVAVLVPLGLGRGGSAPDRPAATPTATVAPDALPANALDTGDDHGSAVVPGQDKVADAWVAKHQAAGAVYAVRLVSDTTAGSPQVAYSVLELWHQGGAAYGVVAQEGAGAPVLVRDAVLPTRSPFIDGVVSAPNGDPFVVYALAKDVARISYDRGDGRTVTVPPSDSNGPQQGLLARTGPAGARDTLTAIYADGRTVKQVVWLGPNDDFQPPPNLLTWQPRGNAADAPAATELLADFARFRNAQASDAAYQPAYTGVTAGGLHFTIGQAWIRGDALATTISYQRTDTGLLQLEGHTPNAPNLLVAVLQHASAGGGDLLVAVPRPGSGPLSYSPNGTSAFEQRANGRSSGQDVALVDRSANATTDRLELLDGDGMHVLYRGPVDTLLCSDSPCATAFSTR